jgi:malic enzyme
LKLNFDEVLSSCDFNFNMRRYITEMAATPIILALANPTPEVWRCSLTPVDSRLTALGLGFRLQSLMLQYDEQLSNFAFNINLRRYSEVQPELVREVRPDAIIATVRRCRLNRLNPC